LRVERCPVCRPAQPDRHLPSAACIADAGSASCQLIPASSQLAPAPSYLCERGLSRRFLGRYGSLLAVLGCVEAELHPVLIVFHASITRTRGKDFPNVLARAGWDGPSTTASRITVYE
jgi:hypothetical protein